MRILRKIAALALAVAIGGQNVAQASTYYYYRGGAQATEASGAKPGSPAPQGVFAILIDAPQIGIRGTGYSATTYAYSNVGNVVFSLQSGTLPTGISINATTGTISGTPSATGTTTAVVQGVDSSTGAVATASLTVEVDDPFSISGTPVAQTPKDSPYSATFSLAGGGQPYGFSVGALPPGLGFNASATSANIGGIPTQSGAYNIIVTGSDSHGLVAQYPYTLQVYDTLTVAGAPPASATVGTPYSGQLSVSGGVAPFTYTLAAGTLPTGITVKSSTGVISGTPTTASTKSGIKIKVTDAAGQTATSAAFSIAVAASGTQALTISVTPVTTGRENQAYTTQYTAGGGSGSYRFSMVGGALPAGVTLNANSGLISGAPLGGTAGTYSNVVAEVVDTASHQAVSTPYTLTISPAQIALSVTGSPGASVQVNSPYAAQFSANGGTGAGYVFALGAGTLPPGLSLSPGGMLSGTPTAVGTYSGIKIRATDNASNTALSNQFAISVIAPPPLTISGSPQGTVIVGNSYSSTWTAFDGSGSGYHFTSVGAALPPGLALSDINGAQGLLTGIATTAGTYSGLQIKVVDSLGNAALSSQFAIAVTAPPPPVKPQDPLSLFGTPVDAVYGQAYSVTFAGGGGSPSYVYSITGTLPGGLSLDSTSGVLSGTPTQIGNFPGLQVTVTDSANATASSAVFAINVTDPNPLSISWTPQTNWQVGDFVAISPDTVGGDNTNYNYSLIGSAPPGLSLFSNGTLFGNLTTIGTFGPFQIQVTDGVRTATTQAATFKVAAPGLFVSGFPAADANEYQAYSAQFSAQGGSGTGYVFSMNGVLPNGLTLNSASGLISGTPTIGSAGTYANLSVHVVDDSANAADSAAFTITVHPLPALVVSGSPPTVSTLGGSYSTLFSASGGTSSGYVFSLGSGGLPPGLALAPDGTLSGSPVAVGTFGPLTVKVTDSASLTAQSSPFSIQVVDDNPLSISWSPASVYVVGDTISITPTASGGVPQNYVFALTGTLPDGTSQNSTSGAITGTATKAGTFGPITITVTDGLRNAATTPATIITVNGVMAISGTPSANAAVGQPYSAQFSVTGGTGTGLVYASAGTALPAGLTVNSSSGLLSGTPTAAGTVSGIVISATDDRGHSASTAPFQIAVADVLVLSATTPTGSAGNAYVGSFSATGGRAPFSYAVTVGSLPTGLSLDPSSGALTGTPTLAESQTVTITVTDANTNTATRQAVLTINAATASATLATASSIRSGSAIGGTLASSLPTPAWTFASTPASPALGLTGSGGAFAGTAPMVAAPTSYSVTATATKGSVSANASPISLTVTPLLAISGTPVGTMTGTPGNAIASTAAPAVSGAQGTLSYALIQGGSPVTLSSACPGLSFSTSSGIVSGTPAATCSTGALTIRVTDAADGATATSAQSFTITISAGSAVASLTTPSTVHAGAPVAGTLATSITSPTWSFTISPASPALTLVDNGNGTFSGSAPAVGSAVSYTVTAHASGGGVDLDATTFTLAVRPPLALAAGPTGTTIGTIGTSLSMPAVTVSNAIGTATYAVLQGGSPVAVGSLCPGLTFGANGAISGTPSGSCSVSGLTIQATDPADGSTAEQSSPFAISIAAVVTFAGTPTAAAQGEAYSFNLGPITSGGAGGYVYTLRTGSLPAGMSLSGNTVSASSVTGSSSTVTIRATDSEGRFKDASLTFSVTGAAASATLTSPSTVHSGAAVAGNVSSSYSSPTWTFNLTPSTPTLGLTASGATFSGSAPAVASSTTFSIIATASQGGTSAAAPAMSLTVKPPLALAGGPTGTSVGTIGTAMSLAAATATNAIATPTYAVMQGGSPVTIGSLCAGLSLSAGTISGTPSAACIVSGLTIQATDPADGSTASLSAPFAISIAPAVAFAGTPATASQGDAYSFNLGSITSGGRGGYTYTVTSGSLPTGMSLSGGSVSASSVTGTTSSVTIRATDADGRSQSASLTFTVTGATASATLTSPTTVHAGAAITGTLSTSYTAPSWSFAATPSTPALGLTASGGNFSGTAPAVAASTSFSVVATASQGGTSVAASAVSLTVKPALSIAGGPSGAVSGTTGGAVSPAAPSVSNAIGSVSFALLHNGSAYTSLATDCPGLSFSSGQISGTPSTPCSVSGLTIRATDAADATTATTITAFSITISDPAVTIAGTPPAATYGQVYSYRMTAGGGSGTGYTFSLASGALPSGLALDATGNISGTPNNLTGTTGIKVAVVDSRGNTTTSAPFAIAVTDPTPLSISWSPASSYVVGDPISTPPTVSGGRPSTYAFTESGTAISGLSVNPSTGAVSGSISAVGTYGPMSITVSDGLRTATSAAHSITATAGVTASGTPATTAIAGNPYSAQFTASGGTNAGFSYVLASGTLPSGLSISTSGLVSGTPTAAGSYTGLSVRATDNAGHSAITAAFSITVTAPTATASRTSTANARTGQAISGTLSTDLTSPTWSFSSSPVAMSASASGSTFSGTAPSVSSLTNITLSAKATGGGGVSATGSTTVNVAPAFYFTGGASGFTITAGNYTATAAASPVNLVASASYALNGSAICPGLVFYASNGQIAGTPSAACSGTYSVTATDSWDGSTYTGPAFTIVVNPVSLPPSTTSYTTPGACSLTIPNYNTLKIRMWGGSGGSTGWLNGDSAAPGNAGGYSYIPSLGLVAYGGNGSNNIYGGTGGTASGGDINVTGNSGANGTPKNTGWTATGTSGAGGTAPYGGGAGGAGVTLTGPASQPPSNGNAGAAPGGGPSGGFYFRYMGTSVAWWAVAGGGAGSGGYTEKTYYRASGPAAGTVYGCTVGAGGTIVNTGNVNGTAGTRGQIDVMVLN